MSTARPGQSFLLLRDVVALLTRLRIDYAVIGALAATIYGTIRATTDADALVSISKSKLTQLEKALENAGFETELRRGGTDDPVPAILLVTDRHSNRVDLLAGLRGLDPEALSRSITVTFGGAALRVIGREDFIAMKCFAGGPQDIADARQAFESAEKGVDVDLLRRVTTRFGRSARDALERLLGERTPKGG